MIDVDAQLPDAGPMTGDSGTDGGGASACGTTGRVGGLCRAGACMEGLECIQEFAVSGAQLTLRNAFGYPQAEATDATNETFREVETPNPANDIPITFANGSLCTEQCDVSADTDMCGSCARCSQNIGEDNLGVPVWLFFQTADRAYGEDTGICRGTCTFDPATNGGCPTGYSCDPLTNLCFESCRNSAQCNGTIVITEENNFAGWVVPDTGVSCSTTTGRCEWENAATATVGEACDATTDCAADIGLCLRGGTCAEAQCATASDTTAEGVCDGGRGICLPFGGNDGSLCVDGCAATTDCQPGNTCVPLQDTSGNPINVGGFMGYCFPLCGGEDNLTCRAGEACELEPATGGEVPTGTCRPTCDPAATPGTCETGETCVAVEGETYGFCETLGGTCGDSTDCFLDQVCTADIVSSDLGRCVDPCEDGMCTPDTDVCQPNVAASGTLAGLCTTPCTMATQATDCGADRVCRVAAGADTGSCVRRPPA
ncbi:Tryptophan synthase alpha chain [Sandaracinus amylolyticus]|uniref:Tryptophan synthase alpha chain n=1 Tax=Sandaracinus amylolyticus TaxID=927083 RepID=A0A0F6SFU5_9BACT|nr:Tryptophan synthase alpha chain [Sandaracinus amylolyticus]